MNLIREALDAICQAYAIGDMYVFGSRKQEISAYIDKGATNPLPSTADVDIGIFPKKEEIWEPEKRVNLTIELEDLFRASRVDLLLLPEVDSYLALDIIRGELIYTDDPDRQARYELYVLRRAADLFPFKKDRIRMILEEGAR